MKTFNTILRQHTRATLETPLPVRVLVSIGFISLFILLVLTGTSALVIGSVIALTSVLNQMATGAWKSDDLPYMLLAGLWYTLLYGFIASFFI